MCWREMVYPGALCLGADVLGHTCDAGSCNVRASGVESVFDSPSDSGSFWCHREESPKWCSLLDAEWISAL